MPNKKLGQQGNLALVLVLVVAVLASIVAVTWVVFKNRDSNSRSESTQLQENAMNNSERSKTQPQFKDSQQVFDYIATTIETSNAPNKLVLQSKLDKSSLKAVDYTSEESNKQLDFTKGVMFVLSRNCEFEECTTTSWLDDIALASVFNLVKEGLLDHEGVENVDYGSEPGSYVIHNYIVVKVSLADGSTTKLQIATSGGDYGQSLDVFTF